jgi:hypothetical protein
MFIKKILTTFTVLILLLGFINNLNAAEEQTALAEKIAADFEQVLKSKGWNTELSGTSLKAWINDPLFRSLNVTVKYRDRDKKLFRIIIDSETNKITASKSFLFRKTDSDNIDRIKSFLVPYLLNLASTKPEADKSPSFYPSLKLGYYRTNDNSEILPEKSEGMFFIAWKFIYDPLREAGESDHTLYLGDYLYSLFALSINREEKTFFNRMDEFNFDIDFLLIGNSSIKISGDEKRRNLFGLFTGIEYYRPYIKSSAVLWSDDVYTDHFHIQYCYWEVLAFIQELTFSENGRELIFKYSIGAGPGQNSSLTATNITDAEEENLNPVFTSNWYGKNGFGDRRHNYYYSMTYPVRFEITADRYLNSRLELKYDFYFFQAIQDKKVYDFLNRFIFNYGFYITHDITLGVGYEFWHVKSIENENRKSHSWNRFNIQMEVKI